MADSEIQLAIDQTRNVTTLAQAQTQKQTQTALLDQINLFLNVLEPFFMAAVLLVNILGNLMTFFFFKQKITFKKTNGIMIAICLCDNGFLFALSIVLMKHINLDYFDTYESVCKMSVFLNYLFGFLSNWYLVIFGIERYLFIACRRSPLRYDITSKRFLFMVFACAVIIYCVTFYSIGFEDDHLPTLCVILGDWDNMMQVFSLVDITLAIFLPFLAILFTTGAIVFQIHTTTRAYRTDAVTARQQALRVVNMRSKKRSMSLPTSEFVFNRIESSNGCVAAALSSLSVNNWKSPADPLVSSLLCRAVEPITRRNTWHPNKKTVTAAKIPNNSCTTTTTSTTTAIMNTVHSRTLSRLELMRKRINCHKTKTLLVLSICFLVLHLPITICKIVYVKTTVEELLDRDYYNSSSSNSGDAATVTDDALQNLIERIAYYIYYVNFSLNFFLHIRNFGRVKRRALV